MSKIVFAICLLVNCGLAAELDLYNFNTDADPTLWVEQSDTARVNVGLSKATLALHTNGAFRRAVFFALLNPQPDGSAFAGVRAIANHDLSAYTQFVVKARAQGSSANYKVTLSHKGDITSTGGSYDYFFTAPTDFEEISIPFDGFKQYYRGVEVTENATAIDFSQISSIGVQAYGGIYEVTQQSGPLTLEIDYIKASS